MSKKCLAVANWKMNHGIAESIKFISDFSRQQIDEQTEVVICPPFTSLYTMSVALGDDTAIKLGAQDCHQEISGAYTGEVSAEFIKEISCDYVILGHSERREYFKEDNELLLKKVHRALDAGLNVVFCVGEKEAEREAGTTFEVIQKQLEGSLRDLSQEQVSDIVIAYEPIWAIGTGKTATPELAQEVHAFIRKWVSEQYGTTYGLDMRILYGGSVKPANIADLMAQQDIDGALVGGASLKPEDFYEIVSRCK